METTLIARPAEIRIQSKSKRTFLSQAFWDTAEYNRFGIVPPLLTIVTCLSALAAAFAAYSGIIMMSIVALPTALFLTMIIAIAPMRWVYSFAAITTLVNLCVILFH